MVNALEIQRENKNAGNEQDKILNYEPPRIIINIGDQNYACILDTGSSVNVMSEYMYNHLRSRVKQMIALPTCGLYCSGAVGKLRQRIKLQCMINMVMNDRTYALIFLVVPKLAVDLIIGCESFANWNAKVDFENQKLRIMNEGRVEDIPFLRDDEEVADAVKSEDDISQDTFFVEYIGIHNEMGMTNVHIEELEDIIEKTNFVDGNLACVECENLARIKEIDMMKYDGNDNNNNNKCKNMKIMSIELSKGDSEVGVMLKKVREIRGLSESQATSLQQVIIQNSEVFTKRIGKCNSYIHRFEVTDLTPFNHKSRPIPSALMAKTDDVIDKMLRDGVIEPSNSQYINPLCIVVKTDGSVRLTVDACELDRRSIPNHYRSEPIDKLLNRINGARYFSSIDLSSSFWQIELAEECRDFTAFIHRGRQYRFCRTPFGISSSSAALIRALSEIFSREIDTYAAIFVDDFCIMDHDYDTHIEHLGYILGRLKEYGFSAKAEKTQLIQHEIQFLGFVISEQGIRPNQKKIEAIMDIPPPKNIRQLRRFLGICQYQARFLISYAKEVQPLRDLLRKDKKWQWTENENEAFSNVKKLFAESILLQRPDYDRPFIIYCDASYKGVGCILIQETANKETRVIATASRSLNNNELRMFSTEIEVCAIYFALQKFREYVFGREIKVRSDNISLEFMQRCKLTSSRISRYIHEIMAYNIHIEHVKGTDNTFADLLSRLTRARDTERKVDERGVRDYTIMRVETRKSNDLIRKLKDLATLQVADPVLNILLSTAKQISQCSLDEVYGVKDKILYKLTGRDDKIWRACIPISIENDVIRMYHESLGHSGVDRVCLTIERDFFIKKLGKKTRRIISGCELCQKAKPMNIKYDIEPGTILREKPNQLICVDTHGPMPTSKFGFKHILVLYDVFSKFTRIYPLKSLSTRACTTKILKDYIPNYGKMESVLSDNASIFASKRWRDELESVGVKCYNSSRYHASSNPCERIIKEIGIYFRVFCHKKQKEWYLYCSIIENIINRSPNPTTKLCPFKLMTGIEPPPLFEGIPQGIPVPSNNEIDNYMVTFEKLKKRAEDRKRRTRRSKHKWKVQVGDQVLVKDHKLSSKLRGRYHRMELLYKGPMIITNQFGSHTYELENPRTNKSIGRYHKQLLRPYKTIG